MKKKGMLLAEATLKLIIAIICLGVLLYFLGSLYFSSQANKERELAKATLENVLSEMEQKRTSVTLFNPEGWYLISWPSPREETLASCNDFGWQYCVCICESALISQLQDAKECSEEGICLQSSQQVVFGSSDQSGILIDNPPLTLSLAYQEDTVVVTHDGS